MQTLRNVWAHLGVVNVMAFMNYELTVKHAYVLADHLQLLQHMACWNLIYRAFRKINLRKLHFVKSQQLLAVPAFTEWQRLVKQIGV